MRRGDPGLEAQRHAALSLTHGSITRGRTWEKEAKAYSHPHRPADPPPVTGTTEQSKQRWWVAYPRSIPIAPLNSVSGASPVSPKRACECVCEYMNRKWTCAPRVHKILSRDPQEYVDGAGVGAHSTPTR